MTDIRGTVRGMLEKGQDPKDYLIEVCRPQCSSYQQKLQRCEVALKNMTNADPELSCMYPMRDWVTCVDACVHRLSPRCNPKSTPNLLATSIVSCRDHHHNHTNFIPYSLIYTPLSSLFRESPLSPPFIFWLD